MSLTFASVGCFILLVLVFFSFLMVYQFDNIIMTGSEFSLDSDYNSCYQCKPWLWLIILINQENLCFLLNNRYIFFLFLVIPAAISFPVQSHRVYNNLRKETKQNVELSFLLPFFFSSCIWKILPTGVPRPSPIEDRWGSPRKKKQNINW